MSEVQDYYTGTIFNLERIDILVKEKQLNWIFGVSILIYNNLQMKADIFVTYLERITFQLFTPFDNIFNQITSYKPTNIELLCLLTTSVVNSDNFLTQNDWASALPLLSIDCISYFILLLVNQNQSFPL